MLLWVGNIPANKRNLSVQIVPIKSNEILWPLSRLVDKAPACAHNAHAESVSIANELLNKLQTSQTELS